MSFSFNPFHDIIETDYSPDARTMRTGWKQKIEDTFFVVAGSRYQFGLFDWCTLGIPFLLSYLVWDTSTRSPILNGFLFLPKALLFILTIPLEIVRYAVAALLTLVSLPISGIVQLLISYSKTSSSLREDVMQLQITRSYDQKIMTLGEYLKESDITLEDVTFKCLDPETWESPEKIAFNVNWGSSVDEDRVDFYYTPVPFQRIPRSNPDAPFKAQSLTDKAISRESALSKSLFESQSRGNAAIFALNIGGTTTHMEEELKCNPKSFVDNGNMRF